MDIKKSGIDGLKPYLTEETKKKVEVITSGVSLISSVGKIIGASDDSEDESNKAVNFLMEKMSEFDFGYKNMIKERFGHSKSGNHV